MTKKLIVIVATLSLAVSVCLAQGRGIVRPAAKGGKVGALGKDYVVLPQVYVWSQRTAVGLVSSEAFPAGTYRIKFEDDAGYYLPAPGKLGGKIAEAVMLYEGGLYVRKDKPNEFYRYGGGAAIVGKKGGVDRESRLPYDFARALRQ